MPGSDNPVTSNMRNYMQEGEVLGLKGMAFLHYIQEQEKIMHKQLAL